MLVFIAIFIISCEKIPKQEYMLDCRCADKKEMLDWVQTCIKNANNMSDEEMEDVINQCESTAKNFYCTYSLAFVESDRFDIYHIKKWVSMPLCQNKNDNSNFSIHIK